MLKTKILALAVLLGLLVLVASFLLFDGSLQRPLLLEHEQVVTVQHGESLGGLLNEMAQHGWLGQGTDQKARRFSARAYNFFTGISRHLHVGEYRLSPGDSLMVLLQRLQRGEVLQRSFTLVDGWNMREVRRALQQAPGLVQTLTGLSDDDIMQRLGKPEWHAEGWFAPDTYFYTAGTSDLDILSRAFERQQKLLDQYWPDRATGLPYTEPYDALIMASIVEKETGVASERQQIAGVFVQRLLRGMRLQTDPTVIYGMGDRYHGNIRRKDLLTPTPYNTYTIRGLPPTPIAMPGDQAIYAALHPADTDALYFVARGDGTHQFSSSLEEHEKAVREYQLKRRQDYRSAPTTEEQ